METIFKNHCCASVFFISIFWVNIASNYQLISPCGQIFSHSIMKTKVSVYRYQSLYLSLFLSNWNTIHAAEQARSSYFFLCIHFTHGLWQYFISKQIIDLPRTLHIHCHKLFPLFDHYIFLNQSFSPVLVIFFLQSWHRKPFFPK